jgi:hypothetical protein
MIHSYTFFDISNRLVNRAETRQKAVKIAAPILGPVSDKTKLESLSSLTAESEFAKSAFLTIYFFGIPQF